MYGHGSLLTRKREQALLLLYHWGLPNADADHRLLLEDRDALIPGRESTRDVRRRLNSPLEEGRVLDGARYGVKDEPRGHRDHAERQVTRAAVTSPRHRRQDQNRHDSDSGRTVKRRKRPGGDDDRSDNADEPRVSRPLAGPVHGRSQAHECGGRRRCVGGVGATDSRNPCECVEHRGSATEAREAEPEDEFGDADDTHCDTGYNQGPDYPVVSLLEDHTPRDAVDDDRHHHRIDPVPELGETAVGREQQTRSVDRGEQDQTVTKESARAILRGWARQAQEDEEQGQDPYAIECDVSTPVKWIPNERVRERRRSNPDRQCSRP